MPYPNRELIKGRHRAHSTRPWFCCWSQGEEIVRRCLYGYSPELALQTSNPIKIPPGRGGKPAGSGSVRITSEHVRNLKHDVEFIKKAHDLRDVGEGKKGKGNPKDAPPR